MGILALVTVFGFLQSRIMAEKTVETYEKLYAADGHYDPKPGMKLRHGTMGISTVAKFSMLSNTPTLFKVKRPGLRNDANTVSFELMQKPGYYLRHKNYKFHVEKKEESQSFEKDATFRERQGPRGRAYELLGRDNWFICHSEDSPFTLKVKLENIGTREFVENCVYVPVKQENAEKKNIVKTVPSGGSMVINSLPSTQTADKCISLRFVNKIGGPVRVVSSLKPEGYLVTANAFKLKTIFKHANHKQRHVIFYAENVQDRDDDVLLNSKNVFTVKPNECRNEFQDVLLSSQTEEPAMDESTSPKPQATQINSETTLTTKPANLLQNSTNNLESATQGLPQPPTTTGVTSPATNDAMPKPPAINDTPKSPTINDDTPKPPEMNGDTPKPPADKPSGPNSEKGISSSSLNTATRPGMNSFPVASPVMSASPSNGKPLTVTSGKSPPNKVNPDNTRYSAPLENRIHNLDNVLEKRIQTTLTGSPVLQGNQGGLSNGYDSWSSFGPCSVSCGVGYRRRTRVCRPGLFCNGASSETRACIKDQCASNCVHTNGGSVRPGSCCHFPFTFNGVQYNHCILSPRSNERLWCSTTPYFDQDKQWGFCPQSAKAPIRSLPNPGQLIAKPQPLVPNTIPSKEYSSYANTASYNDPYRLYKTNTIPCHPLCLHSCTINCPKHCCVSTRADVPFTAYWGGNYGTTDRRNMINLYQPRYGRSLSNKLKRK